MPNPPPPAQALLPLGRTRANTAGQPPSTHLRSHTTYTNSNSPAILVADSIQMIAPQAPEVPSEALSRLNLGDPIHPSRTPPAATDIEAKEVAIRALFQHICTKKWVKKRVKALVSMQYNEARRARVLGFERLPVLTPHAGASISVRDLELPPGLEEVLSECLDELDTLVQTVLDELVATGEARNL